jgi:O-Antigen ligase
LLLSLAVGIEHRALRAVSGAAAVMLTFVCIACGSRAGLIGGLFGLAVLLVGLRQLWLKYAWRIAGLMLVVMAAVLIIRPQPVRRAIQGAHVGIANLLAPVGEAERTRFDSLPVRAVSAVDNQLRLETRRGELVIVNQNGTMSVSDATGRPLEVFVETGGNRVTITDERFSGFELLNGTLNGHPALVVRHGPFVMRFLLTANGFEYVSQAGQPLPLGPVAAWGGKGHEDMASARVYIWSRSIPLLRDTFFVGYGPDTFAAVFPQQDFAGKYLAYGTSEMLVDKPHNFYLQAALSTGVLSVIALILLFLSFVRSASQVYWSQFRREEVWFIGLGCFAGVVGYLCAGTFNDSVVSVAPLFWILLGAGMRANQLAILPVQR